MINRCWLPNHHYATIHLFKEGSDTEFRCGRPIQENGQYGVVSEPVNLYKSHNDLDRRCVECLEEK